MLTAIKTAFGSLLSSAFMSEQSAMLGHEPLNKFVPVPPKIDNSTFANVEDVRTQHFHLDVEIHFDESKLKGSNTFDFSCVGHTDKVVLDTWDIKVSAVHQVRKGAAIAALNGAHAVAEASLAFRTLNLNPANGQQLVIQLPEHCELDSTFSLRVDFETSNSSMALSWMTKEQTAGKKLPYMFSQCESVNCRSIAPLQDTPSVKATYSSRVVAPKEFTVKMSANETSVRSISETHNESRFHCAIPVPSYLMAIVAGDIEYRSLGRRVGVITEPVQMEKVAEELVDLEKMVDEVEKYLTRYIWGNYTIVILPPSFPMGGMENPLLTFASPTIIVGDKSQVSVATHEIAHSWTGNQVTCANWENLWLNEGFTVFMERKADSILYGEDFAKESAFLGNQSLAQLVQEYGSNNSYGSLHPVIAGDNADDSFSEVPYEKGSQFLFFLEDLIGKAKLQAFFRYYLTEHKYGSVTSIDLRSTWEEWVESNFDRESVNQVLAAVNWEKWLFASALAPEPLDFMTPDIKIAQQLSSEYLTLKGQSSPANFTVYEKFNSNLKVIFLNTLQENFANVTAEVFNRIDADLNITAEKNPEVKSRWLPMGLRLKVKKTYDPAENFISSMGRNKYLTPIYTALQKTGQHDIAVTWYKKNIDFYHPMSKTAVTKILGITDKEVSDVFVE